MKSQGPFLIVPRRFLPRTRSDLSLTIEVPGFSREQVRLESYDHYDSEGEGCGV